MKKLKKIFAVPLLFAAKLTFLVLLAATVIALFTFMSGNGFITGFKFVMNSPAVYVFGLIGSIIASVYYYETY